MKSFSIALIALSVAGYGGWRWLGPGAASTSSIAFAAESIATASVKPMLITITEDGYLKAKNSVEVKPEFDGQGKLTWLMEEGKAVKKDDKLAEFDKTEVQQRLDDITNDLTVKETAAETSRAELEIERRDGGALVEAAEFTRSMAKMKIDKHLQGEGPNELRKAKLAAEKAASEFSRATERYRQVPELEREGFLTKTQAEEEKIRLREAEIGKENAEKELELYIAYTEPMAIAELENSVKDTERVLTNAREKAQINLKDREARVTNADRQVKSTRQRQEKLQKHLTQMTIISPIDGILHYGDPRNRWWGEQIKVGNDFYSGNTLFTLPDLREMQAVVRVHEADIDQLKLELPVTVTLESLKGRSLKGKVTEIATVANSDWGDAKTFEVVVTLEPTEDPLRAGVTAKAEILVETLPDCLVIPIHAAFAEGGKHFAFVLNATGFEKRELELGKNNVYLVNVTKGLTEGERVLLFDPRQNGSGGESAKDDAADKIESSAGENPVLSAPGKGN
ncbi:MAG TPA: efflux RND transporter periplasmic adaptor subunit [Planctomycetota bacterium]|nr:efflux RND transporter periplasmic adaptor subunit [Planctomycetota bacterium]